MATLNSDLASLCTTLNADAVKEIIDTDLSDARINNFLNAAYMMSLPVANDLDDCGGATMRCEIIKWLAAHLMTAYERQTKSESVGGEWSVTYLGKDGLGLDSSLYGQQVKAMDCSGKLAKLGMKRAVIRVIDYDVVEDLTVGD